MQRKILVRLVACASVVSVLVSGSATASSRAAITKTVDAAASMRGLARVQKLSVDPSLPQGVRDGIAQTLADASGQRISVTAPDPHALAKVAPRPSWSAERLSSAINGTALVVDRSADFGRTFAQAVSPDGVVESFEIVLSRSAGSPSDWVARSRVNGSAWQETQVPGVRATTCQQACITGSLLTGLAVGVLCVATAIASSGTLAGLVCLGLGLVLAADAALVCESVVKACDNDPLSDHYKVPPPDLDCMGSYNACSVRGVFSVVNSSRSLVSFSGWLSFWFNDTEYGFNIYDANDLGLRATINSPPTQRVWRYDGFLVSNIPNAECAPTAVMEIFVSMGYPEGAQTATARPKLVRPESQCQL